MVSVTAFRFSFTSSWKMLWIAVLTVMILSGLGIWQLHRAEEKRSLLALYHTQVQRAPIPLSAQTTQQYQRVMGQAQSRLPVTFLLDNQHHEHQFGYDVLTPLLLTDGRVLIVDQGWIAGDPSRMTVPDMTQFTQPLQFLGQIYYPASHPLVLGETLEIKTPNLVVIETLDLALIGQFLHKSVYPFIIRQSAEQSSAWVRDWAIVASSPLRHIGYAIQWFCFALGVGMMYIVLHTKRNT